MAERIWDARWSSMVEVGQAWISWRMEDVTAACISCIRKAVVPAWLWLGRLGRRIVVWTVILCLLGGVGRCQVEGEREE